MRHFPKRYDLAPGESYDPDKDPAHGAPMPAGAAPKVAPAAYPRKGYSFKTTGELRNYDPTVQERATHLLAGSLRALGMSKYEAMRHSEKLTQLAALAPVIGGVPDIAEAFRNPNKMNILMASLAAMPGGSGKALKKALREGQKALRARVRQGARIPPHMRASSSAKKVADEIRHVLETKQSSKGKLFREDLGEYTIDFGVPGNPTKEYKGGWGLDHIVTKRKAIDGIDADSYVKNQLPKVLAEGKLKVLRGKNKNRRVIIENRSDQAVLRRYRYGKKPVAEDWLLSGYPKKER